MIPMTMMMMMMMMELTLDANDGDDYDNDDDDEDGVDIAGQPKAVTVIPLPCLAPTFSYLG